LTRPHPTAPLSQPIRKGSLRWKRPSPSRRRTVLRNITAVLEAAEALLADMIMSRVYLIDPAHMDEPNDTSSAFAGTTAPNTHHGLHAAAQGPAG
jgi:enamine deaminase RidA (YjgF/YER057c/UK114 family)